MRIRIVAVGRLKSGPERELYERYAERIAGAGKAVSLTLVLRELGESRASSPSARIAEETAALLADSGDSTIVALDARGSALSSEAFARRLAGWRDGGNRDIDFLIGGPDGLGQPALDRAALVLAFGALTWPHQLVRIMLAEQIYRAVTILSGHPYHRA